jgi:hypothetical protein
VQRHLAQLGLASLSEVTLPSGRRADLLALAPDGTLWIVEIKSSLADLAADTKWQEYRAHCDALWFATLPDVPVARFPTEAGLLVADAYGAAEVWHAPAQTSLAPATRKSLLLSFARLAARRLHARDDPASGWAET